MRAYKIAWSSLGIAALICGCYYDPVTVAPEGGTPWQGGAPAVVPELRAQVEGCDLARIHDTGAITYLIVKADSKCGSAGTLGVVLSAITPAFPSERDTIAFSKLTLRFATFGSPVSADIPAFGHRELSVLREGQWLRIQNYGSWAPRDGAGLLIKGSKIFLLGGWLHGPATNEVWVSENLRQWTFLGFAPWPTRHGAAWLVHQERLYVIGGGLFDDVWSSADGIEWRQENGAAPFGRRHTPNAASLGDKIVVYAGQSWGPPACINEPVCDIRGRNDVWESIDGGRSWSLANPAAPWEGRGMIFGSVVFNDEIYLIGGGLTHADTLVEYSDIWTSVDGHSWQKRLDAFSFAPRTHASVLGTPIGCFVSGGSVGTLLNLSNELLYAADCLNYRPIADPPLQPRHAASLAYFNGTVIILGGPPLGSAGTDVWQYVPAGSM